MKFVISILINAAVSFLIGHLLPNWWWGVGVFVFLTGSLIFLSPGKAFLSGFLGVFLSWFFHALYIDMGNESILSTKIAALFGLPSSLVLIIVTAMLGGLIGGFAALSGRNFRSVFKRRKKRYGYR